MARIVIDVDSQGAIRGVRRLAQKLDNPRPAFDAIGALLVDSAKERFEREAGPGGVPWKKSRRAEEEGGRTLRDSGRLFDSITHNVLSDGVEVGTNVVYAAIHQLGGRTPPRVIRPKNKRALYWPGARHPVKSVNHPGSDIPARPFLGVDEGDRRAIERIIALHLELAA